MYYIFILILVVFLQYLYGNIILAAISLFLLCSFVTDYIYSYLVSKKLDIESEYNDREYNVFDSINIKYRAITKLPVFKARIWVKATRLQTGDNSTDSFVLSNEKIYKYQFNDFGTYRFEVTRVVLYGIFGVMGFDSYCYDSFEVSVYPLPEQSALEETVVIPEEERTCLNPGDDYSEIFEVREYVPGDDFKHIHHALSAKNDEYIIKVGSDLDDTSYIFRIGEYKDFNRFGKILSSIYYACLNVGDSNSFIYVEYKEDTRKLYSLYDVFSLCDQIYEEYIR